MCFQSWHTPRGVEISSIVEKENQHQFTGVMYWSISAGSLGASALYFSTLSSFSSSSSTVLLNIGEPRKQLKLAEYPIENIHCGLGDNWTRLYDDFSGNGDSASSILAWVGSCICLELEYSSDQAIKS
jgi:hypothetical protein